MKRSRLLALARIATGSSFALALSCFTGSDPGDPIAPDAGMTDPSGGTGGAYVMHPELCSLTARCSNGQISGMYGNYCRSFSASCERGCRTDRSPELNEYVPGDVSAAESVERSRVLCEEYRVELGPRRPGDACSTEYDCLPYPESVPRQGDPWSGLLRCVDGTCQERPASQPADYGDSCVGIRPPMPGSLSSSGGPVVEGTCADGLCDLDLVTSSAGDAGSCTMQCAVDTDCPAGAVCRSLLLGYQEDYIRFSSAFFCVDACRAGGECSPAPGPDAGAADAGAADAGAADASAATP